VIEERSVDGSSTHKDKVVRSDWPVGGSNVTATGGHRSPAIPKRQRVRRITVHVLNHPSISSPAAFNHDHFRDATPAQVPLNHRHNVGRGIKLKRPKSWTRKFFKPAIAIQTFVQVYGPFADAVSPYIVSGFISAGPYSFVFSWRWCFQSASIRPHQNDYRHYTRLFIMSLLRWLTIHAP